MESLADTMRSSSKRFSDVMAEELEVTKKRLQLDEDFKKKKFKLDEMKTTVETLKMLKESGFE